jgi:hypothetical protein
MFRRVSNTCDDRANHRRERHASTILQGQIHMPCYNYFLGGDFAEAQHHEESSFASLRASLTLALLLSATNRRGTNADYSSAQQVHTEQDVELGLEGRRGSAAAVARHA